LILAEVFDAVLSESFPSFFAQPRRILRIKTKQKYFIKIPQKKLFGIIKLNTDSEIFNIFF